MTKHNHKSETVSQFLMSSQTLSEGVILTNITPGCCDRSKGCEPYLLSSLLVHKLFKSSAPNYISNLNAIFVHYTILIRDNCYNRHNYYLYSRKKILR